MDKVGKILFDNLELIVAGSGGLAVIIYMLKKRNKDVSNDLTRLYIKYKRHTDKINKSAKSFI